jgi:hypothetical protein
MERIIKPLVFMLLAITIVCFHNMIYIKSGVNYLIRLLLVVPIVVLVYLFDIKINMWMPTFPKKRVFTTRFFFIVSWILFLIVTLLIDWQQFKLRGTFIDPLCGGPKCAWKWLPFSLIPIFVAFMGILRRVQKK